MPLQNAIALAFTSTWSAESQPAGTGAWEDWDISALVPSNAVYVMVLLRNGSGQVKEGGIRANGDSTAKNYGIATSTCRVQMESIPSDKKLELYAETFTTACICRIIGYWHK